MANWVDLGSEAGPRLVNLAQFFEVGIVRRPNAERTQAERKVVEDIYVVGYMLMPNGEQSPRVLTQEASIDEATETVALIASQLFLFNPEPEWPDERVSLAEPANPLDQLAAQAQELGMAHAATTSHVDVAAVDVPVPEAK